MSNRNKPQDLRFIHIHNRFFAVAAMREEIKAREIALFSLIFNIANCLRWPAYLDISTAMLCVALGCKRATFIRTRTRLKDCGIIDFTEGTQSKRARYWFTIGNQTDALRPTNGTATVTQKEDRQEKTDRDRQEDSALSDFDSIVATVEAEFPDRADVRDIAQRLRDYGGVFNATRLKQWVKDEKHPKYKPKKEAPEPEGWRELFIKEYPHAPRDIPWNVFKQKYPEEAKRYEVELAGGA